MHTDMQLWTEIRRRVLAIRLSKRQALERIIKLYESWHAAEPGKVYDAKAAEWRAKLPPENTKSQNSQADDRRESSP